MLIGSMKPASAMPINDLFAGISNYQNDNVVLSNWELVNAVNVDIGNLYIVPWAPDKVGLTTKNYEFTDSLTMSYLAAKARRRFSFSLMTF